MKIATRLKLIGVSSAAVVLAVVAMLFATTGKMQRELAENESASEVLNAVTALRYLSLEYAQRSELRVQSQWQLRSASLAALLAHPTIGGPDDLASIESLRSSFASVGKLFKLLTDARLHARDARSAELASRLTSQISSQTQSMISEALILSERSREGVRVAQQRELLAVAVFGTVVLLMIGAGTAITFRSLVRPLDRLRAGAATVGSGNLAFALGDYTHDELGDVARAFDGMIERLRHSTVSRDELVESNVALQAEVVVRQTAEQKARDQLGRLNLLHQITRSVGERQDMRSIFQVVIRSLEDQLPVDFCCICLYDQARSALVVSCVGLRSNALAHEFAMDENAHIPIDQNGLSQCVQGKLVYEPDIRDVPFPFPQRLAQGHLAALVMAPLLVENTVFGVLVTARTDPHSFNSGECEFLRQLSEHVALAANQTQLYQALQQAYEEMRQNQKAAVQQERLRALGQMASGIAHDINNAISPVAIYTESLLESEPGLSARTRSCLEVIHRAIDDVAATVARMREFYRQREPQANLSQLDANHLVQQVIDLTRARWSDMPQQRGIVIHTRTEFDPALPPIAGVDNEIREALTNLVFNAIDAMPEGGTLTIRTSVEQRPEPGESQVCIDVIDSGVGMSEETRRRCLEPFFTTKGERGTGLGLAMVYGMLERHGAHIVIDSAPGQGTTMRLCFATPATSSVTAAKAAPARLLTPIRILAVDDDPLVLKALRAALENDGHAVVTADSGQAGIDLFQAALARGEPYALVITDLGMPYVDGRKVASAIKAISPATPVLLLTGWGQRIVTDDDLPVHVDRVMSKPPKLADLREALVTCFNSQENV